MYAERGRCVALAAKCVWVRCEGKILFVVMVTAGMVCLEQKNIPWQGASLIPALIQRRALIHILHFEREVDLIEKAKRFIVHRI